MNCSSGAYGDLKPGWDSDDCCSSHAAGEIIGAWMVLDWWVALGFAADPPLPVSMMERFRAASSSPTRKTPEP